MSKTTTTTTMNVFDDAEQAEAETKIMTNPTTMIRRSSQPMIQKTKVVGVKR